MSLEQWKAVDRYISELLVPADPALEAALQHSDQAGLPSIHVSPAQGKLLHLLAKICGSRAILELGTLAGYSALWLARALPPGGRLITLEADARHAEVARANIARAGLTAIIDLRLGPALETLPQLAAQGAGPFDLIFIDADKPNTPEYFSWALRLSRVGTVIIADNVVRKGALADGGTEDPSVRAMRRLHEQIAREPRVQATTLQTVGCKGYDGFTLALVTAP
jgi:predicted O-methyltransferase YrrM